MYNIINNIIYTFLIILNNYNKYVEMSKCRNVFIYSSLFGFTNSIAEGF